MLVNYSLRLNNLGNCGYTFSDSFFTNNTNKNRPTFASTIIESCDTDTAIITLADSSRIAHWYWDTIDSTSELSSPSDTVQGVKPYHLSILKDTGSCSFQDTIRFRINNRPKLTDIGNMHYCTGNLINLNVKSVLDSNYGIQPLSFYWNGNLSQSLDTCYYPSANHKLAHQVIDSLGCIFNDTVYIFKTAPFTLYAGEDTAACTGAPIQCQPKASTSLYSFNRVDWLGLGQGINFSFNAGSSGYVVLEGESNDLCVQRDSFYLLVDEYMNVNIYGDSVFCPNDTNVYAFSGNGISPYQANWYYDTLNSSFDSDTIAFYGKTMDKELSIIAIDSQGCISRDTMILHHRLPFIHAQDSLFICNNVSESLHIDSLTDLTPSSYDWYWHGAVQSVVDSLVFHSSITGIVDQVRLEIMDVYGCISKDTVQVYTSPLSTRIDAYPLVCGGDSLWVKSKVVGATYPLNFNWNIGTQAYTDSQFYFVPVPGNSYDMRLGIQDANGCMTADSFQFLTTNFTIDIIGDSVLCINETEIQAPNPRLAAHPVNYTWKVNQQTSTDSLFTLVNKDFGKAWYQILLVGTDRNGCTASASKNIYASKFAHPHFIDYHLCYGDTLNLPSNDSASVGHVSYSWNYLMNTDTNALLQVTAPASGTQEWTYQAMDAMGCEILDSVSIQTKKLEARILGSQTDCGRDTLSFNSLAYNGYASYQYNWKRNGTTLQSATQLIIIDTNEGSSLLELIVTDDEGCEALASDSIHFYSVPQIQSRLADVYCQNDSAFLLDTMVSPRGGAFLLYGVFAVDTFNPSALNTGIHDFWYEVGHPGCKANKRFDIDVLAQPQVDFYADTVIGYDPFTVRFYATLVAKNPQLVWSFGDSTYTTDSISCTHTYQDSGWFTVRLAVRDSVCANSESKINYIHVLDSLANALNRPNEVQIIVYPNPFAELLYIKSEVALKQVEVFSMQGKRVAIIPAPNEQNELQLDLSNLAPATYILRITHAEGTLYQKVQKTNPAN